MHSLLLTLHFLSVQVQLSGKVSSQYLTALLMAAPLATGSEGIHIQITDELVSQPYVAMTIKLMERFGVKVCSQSSSHLHCCLFWQQTRMHCNPRCIAMVACFHTLLSNKLFVTLLQCNPSLCRLSTSHVKPLSNAVWSFRPRLHVTPAVSFLALNLLVSA